MVAMSISSRSRVRERFFYFISGRWLRLNTMNANSFIRSAAVRGWLVTRRGARLIRDDAQIHNIIIIIYILLPLHYALYYNNNNIIHFNVMYSSVGDGDDHESPMYYIVLCMYTDMCTYTTSHIITYIIYFYVAFWGCCCD